jgi:hypothetical protein
MNSFKKTIKLSRHARRRRNRRLKWERQQNELNMKLSRQATKRKNKKLKWEREYKGK